MDLDLPTLKTWAGRSITAEDVVSRRLLDQFRATLDPHLAPVGSDEAPLGLHWCLAPPAAPMAELGPDGHAARGGFLPPVPLPRRMWAGGAIETFGPLRRDDRAVRLSTVEDIAVKQGRSGPLVFVAVRHEVSTDRGLCVRERHDIVYRDVPGPAPAGSSRASEESARPASASPELAAPDLSWRVEATPVLLFRYSALTFNGHRIHYDHPYATGVEGYEGLVVHGPLQATLLLNIAAIVGNGVPARMDYRGISPLIAGGAFAVDAKRMSENAVACWACDGAGRVTMRADCMWA